MVFLLSSLLSKIKTCPSLSSDIFFCPVPHTLCTYVHKQKINGNVCLIFNIHDDSVLLIECWLKNHDCYAKSYGLQLPVEDVSISAMWCVPNADGVFIEEILIQQCIKKRKISLSVYPQTVVIGMSNCVGRMTWFLMIFF